MLDIRTAIIILMIVRLAEAMSLLYVWKTQESYRPARYWAIGAFAEALGTLFIGLRDIIPVWASVGLGTILIIPGWMIFDAGVVRSCGRSFPWRTGGVVAVLALAALIWFSTVDQNYGARAIIFNAAVIYYDVIVVVACFRAPRSRLALTQRLIGGLYGILIVSCLARVFGIHRYGIVSILAPSAFQAQFFLIYIVFSVIVTILLVLITSQRHQEEIESLLRRDYLTSALNRRAFDEYAGHEWELAVRYGTPLSFMMVDLDHFKQINDRHGHAVGDAALVAVSHAAQAILRSGDVWSRYGGEEFAALLPNTTQEAAVSVAGRLHAAIAALGGSVPAVTVSIGVAEYWAADMKWEDTLHRADEALYRAKAAGRNRTVRYTGDGCADAAA